MYGSKYKVSLILYIVTSKSRWKCVLRDSTHFHLPVLSDADDRVKLLEVEYLLDWNLWECTVCTVTSNIGSNAHVHATNVTCDAGYSENRGKVPEFTYSPSSVWRRKLRHLQKMAALWFDKCTSNLRQVLSAHSQRVVTLIGTRAGNWPVKLSRFHMWPHALDSR